MIEKLFENVDKSKKYKYLKKMLEDQFSSEIDLYANLANGTAFIAQVLSDISWVGFYIIRENELVLGPFQGNSACNRIALGKGVCGTAAKTSQTQLVKNVHDFPGHIACDAKSMAEIVLPIKYNGEIVAVLDLDSYHEGRFTQDDQKGLEELLPLFEKLDWRQK